MVEIERLHLNHLDPNVLKTYTELTPQKYQHLLLEKDPNCLAISALKEGKPIGLILGTFLKALGTGEIHFLHILEGFGFQNTALLLLTEITKLFHKEGCHTLTIIYSADSPTSHLLEEILHKQGWHGPRLYMTHYLFDGFIFNPPWLSKPFKFFPGFQEFPWKELSKEERKILHKELSQGQFPLSVSPFSEENLIEPLNSLGLRYKGRIVGWMITHRIAPDTIRFTALYIKKEFLYREAWIKLLADSINIQRHSPVQWALFDINVALIDEGWRAFVLRRLAPYAQSITKDKQAWLNLSN